MKAKIRKTIAATLSIMIIANGMSIIALADNDETEITTGSQTYNIAEIDTSFNETNYDTNVAWANYSNSDNTPDNEEPIQLPEEIINNISFLSDESEQISYEGQCGENAIYSFNQETGTLTISGAGDIYNYNYSPTVNTPWSQYANQIESIEISNQITSIGSCSFWGCSNLTSIKTFEQNDDGTKSYSEQNKITSNINRIGVFAFLGCTSLESININSNYLEQQCFYGCSSLTNVTLNEGVNAVEYGIFLYCPNIERLTIPSSMNSMWDNSFVKMDGLEFIEVSEGNPNYSNDGNGILYNKHKTKLIYVPTNCNISSFTIPSTTAILSDNAFLENKNLNNISIPDGISINLYMFKDSHFIQTWDTSESINHYNDEQGNHYLIINETLYDFKSTANTATTLNLNTPLTNSENNIAQIKCLSLNQENDYSFIENIIVNRNIKIAPNSLDKTSWYNPNGINYIYEVTSPTSDSYCKLYKYNEQNTSIHIENVNEIVGNAFENIDTSSEKISLYINSNNLSYIDPLAFQNSDICNIYNNEKEINYNDIIISDNDYVTLNGDDGNIAFKNPENFKNQLLIAIANSEYYRGILTNKFCDDLIDKMNWEDIAQSDPYEAVFQIHKWISSNITYGFWETTIDNGVIHISSNNINYSEVPSLSYSAIGAIATKHSVCVGYANLYESIIKNLNNNSIKCFKLSNGHIKINDRQGMHMWNMIGINGIWYYADAENSPILYGQNELPSDYVGYSNVDLEAGYIEKMLKENNISYSYVNDNGETICLNDAGINSNGTLSQSNYQFNQGNNNINIQVHKVFQNENNNLDFNLTTPNNIKAINYHRYSIDNGYYLYSSTNNNFEDVSFDFDLENNETFNNLFNEDYRNALLNGGIWGDAYEINSDYTLYYFIDATKANNIKITFSDSDQLNAMQKIKYKIKDYAKTENISIMSNNWGDMYNYQCEKDKDNKNVIMTDYFEFDKYTDFSGYIQIAGVNVKDISNLTLGDYYSVIEITEKGIKRNVGYYISITQNAETNGKNIDIATYNMGDINGDGQVNNDDLVILNRYLTKHYQFIQTGSDGNLKISAPNVTVNGDLAANGVFDITANNAHFNGTVSAKNVINNVTGDCNAQYILSSDSNAFLMDAITSTFTKEAMMEWYFSNADVTNLNDDTYLTIYNDADKTFEHIPGDHINNNGSGIIFDGGFELDGNNYFENDMIVRNSETFNISSVVYSENGDITINSNNVTINGFIYAPNGKVTINSNNLNITGTIVAKEIEITSNSNLNFNVSLVDGMSDIIGQNTLTDFQLLLADMNRDGQINVFDANILRRRVLENTQTQE